VTSIVSITQAGSPRPSSTIQRSPDVDVFGSSSVEQVAVFTPLITRSSNSSANSGPSPKANERKP
jgi:hypothetical protein